MGITLDEHFHFKHHLAKIGETPPQTACMWLLEYESTIWEVFPPAELTSSERVLHKALCLCLGLLVRIHDDLMYKFRKLLDGMIFDHF